MPIIIIECSQIKEVFTNKFSGYFWIKSECQKTPLRVYCDFDIGKGVFYAYLGKTLVKEYVKEINSLEKAQYFCAKIGLEPLEVIRPVQI